DGRHLVEQHPLDDLKRDAIALLLFGNAYSGDDQEVRYRNVNQIIRKIERGTFHHIAITRTL
ncbi:MAG: hypothetical protein DRI37_00370, partial [Chloroflexi bacterium]